MIPSIDPPSRPLLWGFGVEAVVGAAVLLLAVVLVVPTALLGGFRTAAPPALPVIALGQTVSYGHYRFTPVSSVYAVHSPDPSAKVPGDDDTSTEHKPPALVVTVRMTNLSDGPSDPAGLGKNDTLFLLGAPGSDQKPPDTTILARDGSYVPDLQPRLPENIELVWNLKKGEKAPARIDLTIRKEIYREDFFSQRNAWSDPAPWVRLSAAVKQ